MKVAKMDSAVEKALQEVEAVLEKHKMTIDRSYDGLSITYNKQEYRLRDSESGEGCSYLPRAVESERMEIVD